jgi:hypothetical protein
MTTLPPPIGQIRIPTPADDPDSIDDMVHQIGLAIEELVSWRDELQLLRYQIARGEIKGELNENNELSEETVLCLQTLLDRRSRFIRTLSQMMKQSSAILDNLVRNLHEG